MKKLISAFLILLVLSFRTGAQELSKEFGMIGKPEAELSSYPADKSASAVVLFDLGKTRFEDKDNGFDVIYERSTRIKVFSDAGVKWAEVEIPYYQEGGIFEEVFDLEAYTYNPSGETFDRTTLNPSTCHIEKLNESWNLKKFAMPDVRPGSIFEYRYKIRSQYKFSLRDWILQSKIPTIYSEFELRMIPFYEYTWLYQGTAKFDIQKSYKDDAPMRHFGSIEYQDMIHKFVMKNIPAFNDEEFITSMNDFITKIEFQLVQINNPNGNVEKVVVKWADLVNELLKYNEVTKFSKKCEKAYLKFLNPDSLANRSAMKKFNYVVNYVKANFNWNKIESKYASKSPSDLLKDKFGNSADLNLLAVGLLNAAGIEAYPLILSTRDNGRIKNNYPLMKAFNYVIISANPEGQNILSDATEVFCPNDMIPSRCINEKGLLIKEGPVQWVPLQQSLPSEIEKVISMDSIERQPVAKVSVTASKYDAIRYRNEYGNNKNKIVENEGRNKYKIEKSSVVTVNAFAREVPFKFEYRAGFNAEAIENKIYVSPFLEEVLTDNPLKLNNRTYPIDFAYPVTRTFVSTIAIPQGYKIDFLPKEEKILNEMFELNYKVLKSDKDLQLTFNYTFKKSVYPATEYQNLKYYFNEIIKKGNEKIVFVKAG